ncbi:MAG: zf-HC2 domain-containing protein [Bacteroidaceae bacterium]|nr:zf-HC2 domain-containing protein [Bacteroidaceae bacterium]
MDCKEFRDIVADLFDRDVEPRTKAECEQHISQCAECKEYYEELQATAALLRPRHSPVPVREAPSTTNFLYKVAAIFLGVILLSGIAYAAVRVFTQNKEAEPAASVQQEPEHKMLVAFFLPDDASEWHKKHLGDAICVDWSRGAWIQNGGDSFIEEHPFCKMGQMFRVNNSTVRLDGRELDIHHLPDLPAKALKKMEIRYENDSILVNIITTPVQVPADVKGNINPELTVLLTGTPPKENPVKSSIYVKGGIHDSFNWKQYTYTSWTSTIENIGMQLEEVAIRKDHHVHVNVCRGVPQKHIDRIKKLMQENGVTNYELVNQQ